MLKLPQIPTMTALIAGLWAAPAFAQDALPVIGKPVPGGLGFQPAATELAEDIVWFEHSLLIFITLIVLLVLALMVIVFFRFRAKANPVPATFTHHTPLEIAWTVIPALMLVVMALFMSLPVLFKQLRVPEADVTVKITGYQWYWGYEYPDHEFGFESFMLAKDELEDYGYAQDEFLLATDTAMVVPVNKNVVIQVTGADVIHSWTIPSFGVKQDAVPGRLAELWFKAEKEGIYFGQCSELCGLDHAYMPITVKVVSEAAYNEWLEGAIDEYAGDPSTLPAIQVAAAK